MRIHFDTASMDDYAKFLRVQSIPRCEWRGTMAVIPDEYAAMLGGVAEQSVSGKYKPSKFLFDYQRDISALAITKRKFAVFADCGLGKTLILLEFAKHAAANIGSKNVLIISPLMVVRQTMAEAARWYGDKLPIERVSSANLDKWLAESNGKIGITNYDALHDGMIRGNLGALILDESSMLKSHYGAWGQACIELGRGLEWKLALTGTPAPNDRVEYANHGVFLDRYPTVNAFLARFFVNRGQTDNRWELKPHALIPFYRALADWSIFISNPGVYGWKDNCGTLPPINVHVEEVGLTDEQRGLVHDRTGSLFAGAAGGFVSRTRMASIAKGFDGDKFVASNKPDHIRGTCEMYPDESVIIWCKYNREQETLSKMMPDAANIDGSTPEAERETLIEQFKSGAKRVLITKPRILGFGLNLQIATRHIFSGLQDSYEEYYQAVKRSNRYGSTKPLNVHIPVTEIERPMIDTVLEKASRVESDTREQERLFKVAKVG